MFADRSPSSHRRWRHRRARIALRQARYADVAQLVEHITRNDGVRGSNPRVGFQGLQKRPRYVLVETWMAADTSGMSSRLHRVAGFGRSRSLLLALVGAAAASAYLDGGGLVRMLTIAVIGAGAALVLWRWVGRLHARTEASRRQALTDDLTGLGNRRRLLADLERAIAEGTDHSPAVLAMFDLDGFKAYNDTHGHPAGDALLARLGARLAATFAGSGAAYRLGGDEFCVLLHGSPAELEEVRQPALDALTEQQPRIRSSLRLRPPAPRGPRRLVGTPDRRPAHVRPEGRPPRLGQTPGPRPPPGRPRPARARAAPALRLGVRPGPLGRRASGRRTRTRSTRSSSPPTCTTSARL